MPERPASATGSTSSADIAVVVVAGDEAATRATLRALAEQELGNVRAEVVLVRLWPGPASEWDAGSSNDPLPVRVVDVAGIGEAAAANAGLAAGEAPVVLFLAAGDVPAHTDLLAHHAGAHAEGRPLAVVGATQATPAFAGGIVPSRDGWVGLRPSAVPPSTRHASLRRDVLLELDGLDERLHDLDVAVVELLSRAHAAGVGLEVRPDLLVSATRPESLTAGLRAAARAGRSAQALDALLIEHGTLTGMVGPARSRALLRWLHRPLARAARLGLPDGPRLVRLAHRAAFARGRGRPPLILAPAGRGGAPRAGDGERPPVAIVVPFAGTAPEGERLLDALAAVRLGEDDELMVVDNSPSPTLRERPGVRVVRATEERSSYHARNVGALASRAPWLLFVDADCRPAPWILDAFFSPAPAAGTGAVAGGVLAPDDQGSLVERYSAATLLSQPLALAHPDGPYAVTANLLVRRAAWERLGGFAEGVRSSGDVDFCWRLREDGQELEYRPHAAVTHQHRSTLPGLLRQYRRYGGGGGWLARRYPGAQGIEVRWVEVRGALVDIAAGRFELAAARFLNFACGIAGLLGRLGSNRPGRPPAGERDWHAVGLAERFPDADDGELLGRAGALASAGAVAVEARHRPVRIARSHPVAEVAFGEDDAPVDLLAALLALARRPRGVGWLARAASSPAALRSLAADAATAVRIARRRPGRVVVLEPGSASETGAPRVEELVSAFEARG